jgi:predicted phosphodiesterase
MPVLKTRIKLYKILAYLSPVFICTIIMSCSGSRTVLEQRKDRVDCQYIVEECDCDEDVIDNPDCFKIYSDTHIFNEAKEVPGIRDDFEYNINYLNRAFLEYRNRTFYIGDIVDLSQAEKSEKDAARKEIALLRTAAGTNYIRGNHEKDAFGEIGENRHTIYDDRILFLHGHQLRYPKERTDYLESSRIPKQNKSDWGPSRSLDEVYSEAVKEAKKHNCEIVIFGHTHPDELDDRVVESIRIINVMQGCTYLYLPDIDE